MERERCNEMLLEQFEMLAERNWLMNKRRYNPEQFIENINSMIAIYYTIFRSGADF